MSFAHSLLARPSVLLLSASLVVACSTGTPPSNGDDTPGAGGNNVAGGAALTGGSGGATGGTNASAGAGGSAVTGGTSGTGTSGGSGGAGGSGMSSGGGGGMLGSGGSAGSTAGGSAGMGAGGGAGTGTASGGNGQAGQGGSAGAAAGAAGSSGSGSGGATSAGFFSDDFESGTAGMQPPGWENFISYNKNFMNPNGALLAVVDTMHVHGGSKAVHFHSDGSPVQLTKALMSGTNKLYIRVWVYMTRKLGQQTDMSANHESLIVLRGKSGSADSEIRFGEIKGTVGVNEVASDNIYPADDHWHLATGLVIPANTWSCLEVGFVADTTPNALHSWLDGATFLDVTDLTHHMNGTPGGWENNTEPADWLAQKFAGTPAEIVIGWQSFSNASNDVWMDDLVLSDSPIGGCN